MTISQDSFVHLHVHSEYSLLDGACRLEQLVQQVKNAGQTAVAVTDHGNLYAAVLFYQIAKKAGIKPIIGCEVYVSQRTRHDRDNLLDGKSYHLVLLCQNQKGYQNLIKLVSLANLEGFYKKPRVDWELLEKYHEGLVCLSGCIAGEIPRLLFNQDYQTAKQKALQYQKLFGKENYFLEVQNHGLAEEEKILPLLIRLSQETGIPLAATNDVHYLQHSDSQMQKVMLCIQTNKTLHEAHDMGFPTDAFYLKSTEEMTALFANIPESITNTAIIAERCNLEIRFHERKLPHFVQQGVADNQAYFQHLCEQGMYRLYGEMPAQEVRVRLAHEMQVIEKMGFTDYFLIVWDFVRYARSQDIPVGPGRGSGAGSLCAYCLGITEIDPIEKNLLFERFLNSGRQNMPDIDIDFCIEGRGQVKDYIVRRYGADHVAEIVAFDTLKSKAAVRDVGKVLGIPYTIIDRTAKYMDSRLHIAEALKQIPELKVLSEQNPQVKRLLTIAAQVEDMPRHVTTHAAGVVITQNPVTDYVPVQKNGNMLAAQYTMTTLEELGLLKMDILGLRNLTILKNAEKAVQKHVKGFSVKHIPENDVGVYEMLSSGDTAGVFQLESEGMKNFLRKLKPACMEDIIAALALYRPGPMDNISVYIENKKHPEQISYLHPVLEPILRMTYGCILYQEQVMQICREMAGYSYEHADTIRRAMSKKKQDIMAQERALFIAGAVRNQIPVSVAEQVFAQMENFASYAFNRSHAAAYAKIAYQTAYLKYHYYGDYMAAAITSVISENGRLTPYLEECRNKGLHICLPDVNTSEWNFIFQNQQLYFGLLAVKGLGRAWIDRMTAERWRNGKFQDAADFCRRMKSYGLPKKMMESMIQAGALDTLHPNRKQLLTHYEQIMDSVYDDRMQSVEGQMRLFSEAELSDVMHLPAMEDFSLLEKLQLEKKATGMYLSGHPLDGLQYLQKLLHCQNLALLEHLPEDTHVRVLCMVQSCKKHQTQKGAAMCFLTLEDDTGTADGVVFPNVYASSANRLQTEHIIYLSGRVSKRNHAVSIICEAVREQAEFADMLQKMQLCIKINSQQEHLFPEITSLCQQFSGNTALIYYYKDKKNYALPNSRCAVEISEIFYQKLCQMIPAEEIGCIPSISSKSRK